MAGIAVAGTALVDKINEISAYPRAGELTKILSVQRAAGGCVPNVGVDLKRISPETEVFAFGRVGEDGDGRFIKDLLEENGLKARLAVSRKEKTGFTDVMSVAGGERTFFTYTGANAEFCADDVDFSAGFFMLHLAYFLLLEKIDGGEGLKLLKRAKEAGVRTSIDLVSENSARYSLVLPCLPYVDNLIVNETEAARLAGLEAAEENMEAAAEKLLALGVKERVIVHCPRRSVCLSGSGLKELFSYALPEGYIAGATGAGDAFCAGALSGIADGLSDGEILERGTCAAVAALGRADAVSGVKSAAENAALCKNFSRRTE